MSDFKHKSTDESLITDQSDLDLIRKYTENWEAANAAGDEAGKKAAHDAAEKIRAKYSYSGGVDGSDYIKLGSDVGSSYTTPTSSKADTSWLDSLGSSSYDYDADGSIQAALDKLLNREKFSYDAVNDPLYQQYRKQYTREADRSAENALGKAAVMTGGMPSTAAVTASQQASDYQMSQLTDKIPELQQLAYSMYLNDIDADRADLDALISRENSSYNRWLDERNYLYQLARDQVSDQQYVDELAYNQAISDRNYQYQLDRDAIEDERYQTEWEYQLQQAAQKAASGSSGSGSSGGSSGSASSGTMDYEGLFAAAKASGNPKSWLSQKANYTKYGFTSSSGLYSDYENWLESNGGSESGSGSTGYNSSNFNAAMSSLNTMLNQGRDDAAVSGIDSFWNKLSDAQKAEVQKLLARYGLSYEEG